MSKQPNQNMSGEEDSLDLSKPEQAGTFRLDALGVTGGGSMIEGPPKRRVPVQAVVLGALVVVAGGALYAMRYLGMGPLSAIAEVKLDYDLEKDGKNAGADHKKLLADLSTSQVDRQVPSDQVQKNPFRMPKLRPDVVAEAPESKPTVDPSIEATRIRREKIAALVKTFKVHTVLTGAVPVARIGNDNLRVGDRFMEYFTVVAINGRSVDLSAEDQIYTLTLDDEVGGAKRKARN